MVIGSEYRRIS